MNGDDTGQRVRHNAEKSTIASLSYSSIAGSSKQTFDFHASPRTYGNTCGVNGTREAQWWRRARPSFSSLLSIPSITIIVCLLSASMGPSTLPILGRAKRAKTDVVIDGVMVVLGSASQILSNVSCAPPGIDSVIDCLTKLLQTIQVRFDISIS